MSDLPEGNAIVYCQSAFRTTNGKTAHGLVRRSERYRVLSVVDETCAGGDAGLLLDGREADIPIVESITAALERARDAKAAPTHLVIGLAPDGGRLPAKSRADVLAAINAGLHVDSGLHDFLSDDPEMAAEAALRQVKIRTSRMLILLSVNVPAILESRPGRSLAQMVTVRISRCSTSVIWIVSIISSGLYDIAIAS